MYKSGEIVKDFYGNTVIVIFDTNKYGYTVVQRHNHWNKVQYPTILPAKESYLKEFYNVKTY